MNVPTTEGLSTSINTTISSYNNVIPLLEEVKISTENNNYI